MYLRASTPIFIIICITAAVTDCQRTSKNKLSAVYAYVGIEKTYMDVRKGSQLPVKSKSLNSSAVKKSKEVCEEIFRSSYFNDKQIDPIDVNDIQMQTKLQDSYPNIFQKLYRKSKMAAVYSIMKINQYKYTNPYTLRTIAIPGQPSPKELVISCPVLERQSNGIIREYFVSKAYNVTVADEKTSSMYVSTRFVFTEEDSIENELAVKALAERPAIFLTSDMDQLTSQYLNHVQTTTATDDENVPIYALPDTMKLRLCTLIMNSPEYETKIKFLPRSDFVGSIRQQREIQFQSDNTDKKTNQSGNENQTHEMWAIFCKGTKVDTNEELKYYIANGHKTSHVFVFSENLDGKLLLENEAVVNLKF